MPQAITCPAEVNRQFAERTLLRAADIVARDQPFGHPDAVDALLRAKAELLDAETVEQRTQRTYGAAEIIPDFGQYIASRYPEFKPPAGFGITIGRWCRRQNSRTVSETLRAATGPIGEAIVRRTVITELHQRLNDKEREQLAVLDTLSEFLTSQGIETDIQPYKPYDARPAEFHGQLSGRRWSFAVPPFSRAAAAFQANSDQPEQPVQSALDFAANQAEKTGFTTSPTGARRCLVIANREFTNPLEWRDICWNTTCFQAIAVMHQDDVTATRIWEIQPADAFGTHIPVRTVSDLNQAVQRRLDHNPNINPERLRQAWAAVASSGLTDADILRIADQD